MTITNESPTINLSKIDVVVGLTFASINPVEVSTVSKSAVVV
jgi:hypothetical protein